MNFRTVVEDNILYITHDARLNYDIVLSQQWGWMIHNPIMAILCIIIHIRHFSGEIKPHILLALLPKCDCGPYHTILLFFREFRHFCHIPLYWRRVQYQTIFPSSLVNYAYAQKICALESRIARSVTMERRLFARTLLWRNNHIHDTLHAV